MADFILGHPPVVTFTGQVVTFAKGELDHELALSMTTSHYIAFTTTSAATFAIASNDGLQSDGTWDFTVTGSLAAYTTGVDRATPKVGSTVSNYTTTLTCIAAMNGTTDRLLWWYADTDDNPLWYRGQIGNASVAYNAWGGLPDGGIGIEVQPNFRFYQLYLDCSAVSDLTVKNLTVYPANYAALRYNPSAGLNMTGTLLFDRVRFMGSAYGVEIEAAANDNIVEFRSCYFEGQDTYTVDTGAICTFLNCTMVGGYMLWVNQANIITNCMFLYEDTSSNGGNNVVTTSFSISGNIGTQKTLAELELWVTESAAGRPPIYFPAKATSDCIAAGTNCAATHDMHGTALVNGSYPVGASLRFNMVALNDILKSSDFVGDWNDDNISDQTDATNNFRDTLAVGDGWTGGYDPSTDPDYIIKSQGGNWDDDNILDQADATANFRTALAVGDGWMGGLIPGGTPPGAAAIVSATAGDTQVTLNINAATESDVVYARYRSLNVSTWSAWSAESETFKRTGDGNIVVTSLTNERIYMFEVYAKDGSSTSDWSVPVISIPINVDSPRAIETAIRTVLLNEITVTDVFDTRIYPQQAKWKDEYPLALYTRVNSLYFANIDSLDDDVLAQIDLQVDVFGQGYEAAKAAAKLIRNTLNDYHGTVNGLDIRRVWLKNETDGFDEPEDGRNEGVNRVVQEFEIWFLNT